MLKSIGKVFLKGLAVVVPIGVTLYVIIWLAVEAERLIAPAMRWLLPETSPVRYRTGMGVAVGIGLLFVIGLLTHVFLFRWLVNLLGRILERIPLVKSLYGGLRDLMDFVGPDGTRRMDQVVAVDLAEGTRLLGFLTQDDAGSIPDGLKPNGDEVAVYFPMSYQLGGYTAFVPRDRIEAVTMNVEDAMRYALTAGMSTHSASREGKPMSTITGRPPETDPSGGAPAAAEEPRNQTEQPTRQHDGGNHPPTHNEEDHEHQARSGQGQ